MERVKRYWAHINGERYGGMFPLWSGRIFWPLDPRPEEIFIQDIAHGLAMSCRFAGQCWPHASTANHCILVSKACDPEHALEGLLHDAPEALGLGDMIRPVKQFMPKYQEADRRLEAAVAERYRLTYPWPEDVHWADHFVYEAEHQQLRLGRPPLIDQIKIPRMTALEAKQAYMIRFVELATARGLITRERPLETW